MPAEDLQGAAARAAAGDGAAFAVLVRATQADVRRLCAVLVDREAADDLAQETYLRAHRALSRYDGRAPVRVWLAGIARHVCVDELRGRMRRRRLVRRIGGGEHVADPSSWVDLRECVKRLPVERREAFALTQLFGFSYEETAAICRCPVGTIRSRVARARDELRDYLAADAARELPN